jgi:hypothetical protein
MYTYEEIIETYGHPILQFTPSGNFTEVQIMSGDIPSEIMIVKINHVSEFMVLSRIDEDSWVANHGERWVIRELLKKLDKNNK